MWTIQRVIECGVARTEMFYNNAMSAYFVYIFQIHTSHDYDGVDVVSIHNWGGQCQTDGPKNIQFTPEGVI